VRIRSEKDHRSAANIVESIRKLGFSIFGLKADQKELSVMTFKSNNYTHEGEFTNLGLDLEHHKNLALIEIQRQRTT